jgi:hypothetical protein
MENNIPEIDETLSHAKILEIVKDYVKENVYQYALLLDGEWGSGKSHFVKNYLKGKIEKSELKVIYISLYGISSLDMLHTAVINAYWAEVSPNIDMIFKVTTALSPAFNLIPYLGSQAEAITSNLHDKAREKFIDLEKCFFIFDDLERCSAPIHDVLGYINNLIEHHSCKVLIVSNEAECSRVAAQSRSEIQLISAALLKDYIKKEAQKSNIELTDIQKFTDELFGENELYLATKEKLIGKTIKYVPQLELIVPEIISGAFPDGEDKLKLKDGIAKNCIDAMMSEKVTNLRILQYALSYFKKIYDLVLGIEKDTDVRKETLLVVLNAIIRVAVRARVRSKDHLWNIGWVEEGAYANVSCLPDDKKPDLNYGFYELERIYFISFKFVHKYVLKGSIDQDEIVNDLSAYIDTEIEKKQMAEDPYSKLKEGWWTLSEEELITCVEQIETKLLKDGYSANMCINIVHLLLRYSQELECETGHPDKLFEHIKEAVSSDALHMDLAYDNYLSLGTLLSGQLEGDYKNRFDKYISELRGIIAHKKYSDLTNAINQFDGDDWSDCFADVISCEKHKQMFLSRGEFLSLIDVDMVLKKLNGANGAVYKNLLIAFQSIYDFPNLNDHYAADIPNLKKLIDGLKGITIEDMMIRMARNHLVKELEVWLKKIEDDG